MGALSEQALILSQLPTGPSVADSEEPRCDPKTVLMKSPPGMRATAVTDVFVMFILSDIYSAGARG